MKLKHHKQVSRCKLGQVISPRLDKFSGGILSLKWRGVKTFRPA